MGRALLPRPAWRSPLMRRVRCLVAAMDGWKRKAFAARSRLVGHLEAAGAGDLAREVGAIVGRGIEDTKTGVSHVILRELDAAGGSRSTPPHDLDRYRKT